MSVSIGGEAQIRDRRLLADRKVVSNAYTDLRRGGYPALRPHLKALERVLANAPASYPKVEMTDGHALFRADPGEDVAEMTMAGMMAGVVQKKSVIVERTLNVYPWASFMLGGYAVDTKRPDEAIAYLDKGLALQPAAAALISEKGAALQLAKRPAEALAVYDSGLAADDIFQLPSQVDRARMLRGRGYSLGELGRLDEAVAAYQESLKIEPDNALAKGELRYLAELKAGRPPSTGDLVIPGGPRPKISQP